jgi:hypothetical protein
MKFKILSKLVFSWYNKLSLLMFMKMDLVLNEVAGRGMSLLFMAFMLHAGVSKATEG